jgi:hypothetical protein
MWDWAMENYCVVQVYSIFCRLVSLQLLLIALCLPLRNNDGAFVSVSAFVTNNHDYSRREQGLQRQQRLQQKEQVQQQQHTETTHNAGGPRHRRELIITHSSMDPNGGGPFWSPNSYNPAGPVPTTNQQPQPPQQQQPQQSMNLTPENLPPPQNSNTKEWLKCSRTWRFRA